MTTKQKIRYAVDLGMTALLPLLMAYSLVGEVAHEWLGMAMLALFIVHHCLNRTWLKNLPRGRYSGFRILQTALAALILLTMLGTMVSGIAMSRYAFSFLHLRVRDWSQSVHLFCSYWGFLLMSLHLCLHGAMVLAAFRRMAHAGSSKRRTILLRCAAGAISALGIATFARNRLTDYLLLRTHFVMLASLLLNYLSCGMRIISAQSWRNSSVWRAVNKSASAESGWKATSGALPN